MSLFHWKSARRVLEGRQLEPIPAEIYDNIFSYFEPSETFSATRSRHTFARLALVCRYFASQALPKVLQRIEILPKPDLGRGQHEWAPFFRQLVFRKAMSVELAEFIEDVAFDRWSTSHGTTNTPIIAFFGGDHSPGVFLQGLPRIRNLHTLRFARCSIKLAVFQVIMNLPGLKDLSFDDCSFSEEVSGKAKGSFKLETLSVDRCPTFVTLLDFFPLDNLQNLRISSMNMVILSKLLRYPGPLSLRSLIIESPTSVPSRQYVLSLLLHCPHLRHFEASSIWMENDDVIPANVSLKHCPSLDSVAGTKALVFIPMLKPLSRTSFHNLSDIAPEITTLGVSANSLSELSLELTDDLLEMLAKQQLSSLQQLSVICAEFRLGPVFTSILETQIPHVTSKAFPSLHNLRIHFHSCDSLDAALRVAETPTEKSAFLALTHSSTIQDLHLRNPLLTDVMLGPAIQWHLCNLRWFPAIPVTARDHVRKVGNATMYREVIHPLTRYHPDLLNEHDE